MAKYEYIADQDALKEFVGEINAQCWRYGYKTQTELGKALGVSQVTAGKYRKDPTDMTFATLRRLIKVLKPNPLILLRALGYSSRDIKQLFEKNG